MILAYLRNPDFIKPNYIHGTKSRLREELFIKTAALEFSKEMNSVKINVLRTYLTLSEGDSRSELLDNIVDTLERIEGTYSFEFGASRVARLESSRSRMVKAVELLNKKGLVGVSDGFTPEKVREIIEDYRKNKVNDN
jgi:reverse gyrase